MPDLLKVASGGSGKLGKLNKIYLILGIYINCYRVSNKKYFFVKFGVWASLKASYTLPYYLVHLYWKPGFV